VKNDRRSKSDERRAKSEERRGDMEARGERRAKRGQGRWEERGEMSERRGEMRLKRGKERVVTVKIILFHYTIGCLLRPCPQLREMIVPRHPRCDPSVFFGFFSAKKEERSVMLCFCVLHCGSSVPGKKSSSTM
jgi:hypothetical protein